MVEIDVSTEFGARVAGRLDAERVIWLTTVQADGTPEPVPVWFLWDGASVLIYSRPDTVKLRNIAARPKVALNFNADVWGDDVVVLTGDARIDADAPPVDGHPAFVAKYQEQWGHSGALTPEQTGREYSVAIRVTPTRLRGF